MFFFFLFFPLVKTNFIYISASSTGKYTIFGHVIDGMDTLDKMERVPTAAGDRPIQEIRLNRVTLHANPLAQ